MGLIGFFFFISSPWDIIEGIVTEALQHFFASKKLYKASNAYFLALIPKTKTSETFVDFRP